MSIFSLSAKDISGGDAHEIVGFLVYIYTDRCPGGIYAVSQGTEDGGRECI